MPIYLDRHDTPNEITPEHVAEMHQKDLEIQHEFGCRGFTYWFDDKRKTGFCLIEAPNKDAIIKMHNHAHGAIPSEIIEVEEHFVEAFLGRLGDPEKKGGDNLIIRESAFRIIMVTHIKMTSLKQKNQNEEDLQAYNHKIVHIVKSHYGRIVNKEYKRILVSFVSVSNALNCAVELQSEFENFVGHSIDSGLHLKIGLSSGVPLDKMERLFEDTINLSKSLCDGVNGIIGITSEIKSLAKSENLRIPNDKKLVHSLNPLEERFLIQLMNYIEQHWQNADLKIEDICEHLGQSKSTLYRLLKSISGKSPNVFIKDYRLEKALDLLSIQKGNISEIAFDCGFNSLAYFSKCFYENFGVLPSAYAKMIAKRSF